MNKQLYRSTADRKLGGVCGGLGEFFDIDPTIIRIGWIILSLLWGFGVIAYIIAWVVIPEPKF